MIKTPLLIYSDCPDGVSGLGRITRDLATHIYSDPLTNEIFEVATYGYGAIGSRNLPWPQYTCRNLDCIHPDLRRAWEDFAQGREGVLMPIMPPSWLFGLMHPEYVVQEAPKLADTVTWLQTKPFQVWPYLAIESCGPNMQFSAATCSSILRATKPLFYSRFGQKVAENSGLKGIPFIHHGIYTDQFKFSSPETIANIREELHCNKDTIVVGCCATNSGRKRLGLLVAAFADFQERYEKNSKLWLHTNSINGCWNIPELMRDYGFTDNDSMAITLSSPYHDDQWMSNFYSTCAVTVLPTHGEGFGYPIMESQACGTPCITGSFACEAELVPPLNAIGWLTTEPDGIHNLLRPNYNYLSFSHAIKQAIDNPNRETLKTMAYQWDWSIQWPKFREWLLK